MKHVGSYEAKTHLAELLDAVERGEAIVITRRGRPAVQLVSIKLSNPDASRTIEEFKEYSKKHHRTLGRISYRSLIEDGRRF